MAAGGASALSACLDFETGATTPERDLSQDPRWLHFGLGNESVQRVRVVFPDGTERTYEDVPTNSSVVLRYDGTSETLGGS